MYQNNLVPRKPNTNRQGNAFTDLDKATAWYKLRAAIGYPSEQYRLDACGQLIRWADYGNTNVSTGWEIDHIIPVAHGGTDLPQNLQALQWQTNRRKSDNVNINYCLIRNVG